MLAFVLLYLCKSPTELLCCVLSCRKMKNIGAVKLAIVSLWSVKKLGLAQMKQTAKLLRKVVPLSKTLVPKENCIWYCAMQKCSQAQQNIEAYLLIYPHQRVDPRLISHTEAAYRLLMKRSYQYLVLRYVNHLWHLRAFLSLWSVFISLHNVSGKSIRLHPQGDASFQHACARTHTYTYMCLYVYVCT